MQQMGADVSAWRKETSCQIVYPGASSSANNQLTTGLIHPPSQPPDSSWLLINLHSQETVEPKRVHQNHPKVQSVCQDSEPFPQLHNLQSKHLTTTELCSQNSIQIEVQLLTVTEIKFYLKIRYIFSYILHIEITT